MSAAAGSRDARGGRLSLRTLVVASLSSAIAAVVSAQIWRPGTPLAAALTPVIVALVSELLERPLERIEPRLRRLPPATARSPRGNGEHPSELPAMRIYRPRVERRRRALIRVALVTGLLGFLLGGAALTVSELLAGGALGGHGRTTLLGGAGGEAPPARTNRNPTEPVVTPTSPERPAAGSPTPRPDGQTGGPASRSTKGRESTRALPAPNPSGGTTTRSDTSATSTTPSPGGPAVPAP